MNKMPPWQKTVVYLICSALFMMIIIPLMMFFTTAFSSSRDLESSKPRLFPSFQSFYKITYLKDSQKYKFEYKSSEGYKPAITSADIKVIKNYLLDNLMLNLDNKTLQAELDAAQNTNGGKEFSHLKSIFRNFVVFFMVTNKAKEALFNSLIAVLLTILISISLGSLTGYTIARFDFVMKDQINVLLLIVRMFPMVGITIPLMGILIRMGLYDTMLGLSILYALPNIALTSWITSSIFIGIGRELEEASLVFGANAFQTFTRITLPLALPAIAASSMYAFLEAWNDTLSALILTQNHPTLALSVYQAVGSTMNSFQYAAAGGVILIIPALVFTFIVRKYISSMWGAMTL